MPSHSVCHTPKPNHQPCTAPATASAPSAIGADAPMSANTPPPHPMPPTPLTAKLRSPALPSPPTNHTPINNPGTPTPPPPTQSIQIYRQVTTCQLKTAPVLTGKLRLPVDSATPSHLFPPQNLALTTLHRVCSPYSRAVSAPQPQFRPHAAPYATPTARKSNAQ